MKKDWIYQIRALAIIAVVVCHQQRILHDSEVIQLLTLYSVTTLVFLMGVTKAFSLKNHYLGNECPEGMFRYSLRSMMPILCSYAFATIVYTYRQSEWLDCSAIWSGIVNFSASPPFYFIRYYVILSLWAPFLYSMIKYVLHMDTQKKYKMFGGVAVFILIWLVGYESINRMDIFGRSYFFVYAVGLLVGQVELPRPKMRHLIPGFAVLLFGLVSTKRYYWAKLAGVENYSGGINFLAPKLQMNPPNLSIILYSFGVICVAYLVFEMCNNSNMGFIKWVGKPFCFLGKYSMDIFLWHLFIQNLLNGHFQEMERNIFKWGIYYGFMFLVPSVGRWMYNKMKERSYAVLKL